MRFIHDQALVTSIHSTRITPLCIYLKLLRLLLLLLLLLQVPATLNP
jgi:hypothetical protein